MSTEAAQTETAPECGTVGDDMSHIETVAGRLKERVAGAKRLSRSAVDTIRDPSTRSILIVCADCDHETSIEAAFAYALQVEQLTGAAALLVDMSGGEGSLSRDLGAEDLIGLTDYVASDNQHPDIIDAGPLKFMAFGTKDELRSDDAAIIALNRILESHRQTYRMAIWVAKVPLSDEQLSLVSLFGGVVIALRSERSRLTAARDLRERLYANGAHILGVLMCRRRLTIPNWLYNRL